MGKCGPSSSHAGQQWREDAGTRLSRKLACPPSQAREVSVRCSTPGLGARASSAPGERPLYTRLALVPERALPVATRLVPDVGRPHGKVGMLQISSAHTAGAAKRLDALQCPPCGGVLLSTLGLCFLPCRMRAPADFW
eukprot:scaffold339_cov402-Prasinococcus_capsulatus_cf.AAC.3